MKQVNLDSIEEERWGSPGGRFLLFRKWLSGAVGGLKDVGTWGGGHPFDLELARLPAGRSNFPLHHHSAQSELYLLLEGCGVMHGSDGARRPVSAGDVIFCGPGEAHRLENTGETDLRYLLVADHPREDVCSYPESGKRFLKPQRLCVDAEGRETSYFGPDD